MKKILIFQRKPTRTLMNISSNFMLLHWKKTHVLSFGMPPFIGSNCIRKKGLENVHSAVISQVQYSKNSGERTTKRK